MKERERDRRESKKESGSARDSALKYFTILPKLPYENSTSSVAFSMKLGVGIATISYYTIYNNQ